MADKIDDGGAIYISLDKDTLSGGLQISVGDNHGGYRVCGPKYSGSSRPVMRHEITARDIVEIGEYLKRADAMIRARATHKE